MDLYKFGNDGLPTKEFIIIVNEFLANMNEIVFDDQKPTFANSIINEQFLQVSN